MHKDVAVAKSSTMVKSSS